MRTSASSRRPLLSGVPSSACAVALALGAAAPSLFVALPQGQARSPLIVVQDAATQEPPASIPAVLPATPAAVNEIVAMRPFVLDEGFTSDWSAERPMVRSGWIVVVRAESALLRPRQTQEPILFVGDQVAERLNSGGASGHTVVIVPAEIITPADGAPADAPPTVTPILVERPAFFGTPGIAEAVTREVASVELAQAIAAGFTAPPPAVRTQALARGGDLLQVADRAALLVAAAALVRTWSPDESARALELEGLPITGVAAPAPQPAE